MSPNPIPTCIERIQAFSFDEHTVALPFASRLARKNGWPIHYAHRTIEEYRKFIYRVS